WTAPPAATPWRWPRRSSPACVGTPGRATGPDRAGRTPCRRRSARSSASPRARRRDLSIVHVSRGLAGGRGPIGHDGFHPDSLPRRSPPAMKFLLRPALFLSPLVLLTPARADEPADVQFTRDVRPILAGRCFKCHGPDLKKGGLDLQTAAGATKLLTSG